VNEEVFTGLIFQEVLNK